MPTDTFFRLPKEKQDVILKSARNEFSTISYNEVSINQIILNAKIPRGSFYMYFKDKEDLYFYLTEVHQKEMRENFLLVLKKNNGDLITTYLKLFQMVINHIEEEKEKNFFKNMILNMNFKNDLIIHKRNNMKLLIDSVIESIDVSLLKINNREELIDIFELIHMSFIHGLVKIFEFDCNKEDAYQTFYRQLMILKDGFVKEGGEDYD